MTEPKTDRPVAIAAAEALPRRNPSTYPPPFAEPVAGREKRPLGDPFGLANFGVNRTRLAPGAVTALHHGHSVQDEFVYVLEGAPTLITDQGETPLRPGMCAGFPAGGPAHHVVNRTTEDVVLLEIGDRGAGDQVSYPSDDLKAALSPDGQRTYTTKDGTPY